MIPIVVLVGHSNVGKSTIFNCLTRTRDALATSVPKLTRDRKYGYVETDQGNKFICIDTGSLDEIEQARGIDIKIIKQSLLAIEEANLILFIVDAHVGLLPIDSIIAKYLRSYGKPIFLIINKVESVSEEQAITDFQSLGLTKIYLTIASHGHGITDVITAILAFFAKETNSLWMMEVNNNHYMQLITKRINEKKLGMNFNSKKIPIKLAIVGRPNVGKSMLVNHLVGKERMIVCDMPGTTRDSNFIPIKYNNNIYILIDTAGIHKREKNTDTISNYSIIKTTKAIEIADVILLVLDARNSISNQDLSILKFILDIGRSLVIAVNKWDNLSRKIKKQIKLTLNHRLDFINYIRINFISALYGTGIYNLFRSINEAYEGSYYHIKTTALTKTMNIATECYQPPLIRGRRAKLKYAHIGGYNPPTIVIHGNQLNSLPNSYKRYLIKYFHKSLNIIGSKIRLQFKEGSNPYINKYNVSTKKYKLYKKRRTLIKFPKNI